MDIYDCGGLHWMSFSLTHTRAPVRTLSSASFRSCTSDIHECIGHQYYCLTGWMYILHTTLIFVFWAFFKISCQVRKRFQFFWESNIRVFFLVLFSSIRIENTWLCLCFKARPCFNLHDMTTHPGTRTPTGNGVVPPSTWRSTSESIPNGFVGEAVWEPSAWLSTEHNPGETCSIHPFLVLLSKPALCTVPHNTAHISPH